MLGMLENGFENVGPERLLEREGCGVGLLEHIGRKSLSLIHQDNGILP